MRPVRRGASPQMDDFVPYTTAKPSLVAALGPYCSFCERRIATMLEVEHIQPKALPQYADLQGTWTNFLLACRNCNATKSDRDVILAEVLLHDRDNTYAAFTYSSDGKVTPAPGLDLVRTRQAIATLKLTGLDKASTPIASKNGNLIALDRAAQRMEAWSVAEEALRDIRQQPENELVKSGAVRAALGYGFFSIWMAVFATDTEMRNRLIDAFTGTRDSGCFTIGTGDPITPAPNPDRLPNGSKV
jgi:hypothetical protein